MKNDNHQCLLMIHQSQDINWNFKGKVCQETVTTLGIKHKSTNCLEIMKSTKQINWNLKNKLQESPLLLSIKLDNDDLLEYLLSQEKLDFSTNLLPEDLQKKACCKTICYIRKIMKKETNLNQNANIFEEFLFAVENNFSPITIQLLIFGLTTEDITFLIIHWENNKQQNTHKISESVNKTPE